jgi:hypothetical protein
MQQIRFLVHAIGDWMVARAEIRFGLGTLQREPRR